MKVKVTQSCLTLCNSRDCSPPGSSVHAMLQAGRLEEGCHALLQGIFLPQQSNPGSPVLQGNSLPFQPQQGVFGEKKKRKMNFPAEQSFPRYLHNLWSLLKGQRLGFGTRRHCAMASWTNWCLSIECVLFEFSEIPAKGLNILCARGFECKWRGRGVSGVPKRLSKLNEIVRAIAEVGSSTS